MQKKAECAFIETGYDKIDVNKPSTPVQYNVLHLL